MRDTKHYRNRVEEVNLQAGSLLEQACEYRRLADTLLREAGPGLADDRSR